MRISPPGKNEGSFLADALCALLICALLASALVPGISLLSRFSAAAFSDELSGLSERNRLVREGLDELSP